MPEHDSLERMQRMYPDRFFDEGTLPASAARAVVSAAELALAGGVPVLALPSAFLLRACDRILTLVCRKSLHVVLTVRQTELTGGGEEEPPGIFDLSMLSVLPGMTVMAPKNRWELEDMLGYAVNEHDGPIALCCPRGEVFEGFEEMRSPIRPGRSEILYDENGIALIAVGSMVKTAQRVRAALRDNGWSCSLINARFVKPLDEEMVMEAVREHRMLVTLEENVRSGGFGDHVLEVVNDIGARIRVLNAAISDSSAQSGSGGAGKESGIDEESILMRITAEYVGMQEV